MIFLSIFCLCLAPLCIWQENQENHIAAAAFKGMASLCFVCVGFLAGSAGKMSNLILIGLILGCVADVLLNLCNVFHEEGQVIFLFGILVFLCGHFVYLAAVLPLSENRGLCFAIGTILTAALMKWMFTRISAEKLMKTFGIIYVGTIMILNCIAIGNLISLPSAFTFSFAFGVLLFLISDIVLILNTFSSESSTLLRMTDLYIYYIGQLLIAWSLTLIR